MGNKILVSSISLVFVIFALQSLRADQESKNLTTLGKIGRQGKQFLFPFFGVGLVRFVNGLCTGYGNLWGTCYTRRQCTAAEGTPSSTCARSIGVCCIITRTCGGSSQINNTYFTSPGFPNTYTTAGACTYTIEKIDASVCQVRIDFLTLRLAQPNATGACITDAVVITGGASPVPVLCGENTGQHMYIDFNGDANIIISIATTGAIRRSWNIRVMQLNCNCPYKAPSGCLQYFTSQTGTVTSFNYGNAATQNGNRQLINENYGVCIAEVIGYCGITWSQNNELSFSVTGDTYTYITAGTVGTIDAEQFGTDCTTDFVVIPSPVFANGTALSTDRFCGNGFVTVTSNSKPFVLTVVTNSDETNDVGNVGFALNYAQTRCLVLT